VQVVDSSSPQQAATHSYSIVIQNAVAYTLVFTVQPSTTEANAAIEPPVKAKVTDSNGKLVKGAVLTASLSVNPTGAKLTGTKATTGANGIATFNNQSINKSGTGYKMQVTYSTSQGSWSATSNAFNIEDDASAVKK